MAATVQSDQYQIFMRKIGYSVGLENTLPRITDLAQAYLSDGKLTIGTWNRLVSKKWGLENDHIGDFFRALNLVDRTKTTIDVRSGLDAIALTMLRADKSKASQGLAATFLLLLIEHDGEVFLNCLAADFDGKELVRLLKDLTEYKRRILFEIYKSPEIQAKLARVVGIDRQATNIGGAGKAKSLSGQKRTGPLTARTDSLKAPSIPPVIISDDYLRKVLPKRRDWAVTVGLYDSALTSAGVALLKRLDEARLRLSSGAVVLWPFSHEIGRFRMNPTAFESRIIDYWDLVTMAIIGAGGEVRSDYSDSDRRKFLSSAGEQIKAYRTLNRPKAMLRRELPLTIAYITIANEFLAEDRSVPNLPMIISDEQKMDSILEIRTSRNSIGTLALKR